MKMVSGQLRLVRTPFSLEVEAVVEEGWVGCLQVERLD